MPLRCLTCMSVSCNAEGYVQLGLLTRGPVRGPLNIVASGWSDFPHGGSVLQVLVSPESKMAALWPFINWPQKSQASFPLYSTGQNSHR